MGRPLDGDERRELRRKARGALLAALGVLGGEARRSRLLERALADGGFTPLELSAPPPQAAAEKYTRLIDHQLSWSLTDLRRDGLVENPSRSTWRLSGAALETPTPAVGEPLAADRLTELRAMRYREYLQTPEWRRTRAAALQRAGHCCSLDVTHTEGLEVHHRTYARLGNELATDLTVLCRPCHQLHHRVNGRPRRTSAESTRAASVPPPERSAAAPNRKPSLLRRLLAG
jgi:hypothetical protein